MSEPSPLPVDPQVGPVPGACAPDSEAPLPEEAVLAGDELTTEEAVAPEILARGDGAADGDDGPPSVEDILEDLERVTAERDEFLLLAQSKQAELENLRKRVVKQQADEVTRRTASVVRSLLPVLDAFDYGVAHGDESLKALQGQLLGVLGSEGLERVGEVEVPFDPEQHEAVAHDPGDDGGQVVTEVLRAGYRWQGHLVRPAMVKVRG